MKKMWWLVLAVAPAFASCANFGAALSTVAGDIGNITGGLVGGAIGGAAGNIVGSIVSDTVEIFTDATGQGLIAAHQASEVERAAAVAAAEEERIAARAAVELERVTAHAVGEVGRVLPMAARLWIHSDATTYQALASNVIDNMTVAFLTSGFTVVERGMIDLVTTEQNLHLGGFVADGDFVSIGNLAGANTTVIVSIIGTGAMRRLQVRVLDIETGTVTMQSGTGSEWGL